MMPNRLKPQILTRMIQKLLELATILTTKIVATMVEKKMIPLITQMEMNLQKRTIQAAKKMIIILNPKTMAQANQVAQVVRMTLPETELCDNSRI